MALDYMIVKSDAGDYVYKGIAKKTSGERWWDTSFDKISNNVKWGVFQFYREILVLQHQSIKSKLCTHVYTNLSKIFWCTSQTRTDIEMK